MDSITIKTKKDNSRVITQESFFYALFGQSVDSYIQELKNDNTKLEALSKRVIA